MNQTQRLSSDLSAIAAFAAVMLSPADAGCVKPEQPNYCGSSCQSWCPGGWIAADAGIYVEDGNWEALRCKDYGTGMPVACNSLPEGRVWMYCTSGVQCCSRDAGDTGEDILISPAVSVPKDGPYQSCGGQPGG